MRTEQEITERYQKALPKYAERMSNEAMHQLATKLAKLSSLVQEMGAPAGVLSALAEADFELEELCRITALYVIDSVKTMSASVSSDMEVQ